MDVISLPILYEDDEEVSARKTKSADYLHLMFDALGVIKTCVVSLGKSSRELVACFGLFGSSGEAVTR